MTERKTGTWYATRTGTLSFDLKYIMKKPLTGWGANPKTRFSLNPEMIGLQLGMGNGMSDFLVKYGVIGFLTFLYLIFQNFNFYLCDPIKAGLCVLLILLTLQGETFLGYPLYLGLMFLNESQKNTKIKRKIIW
jgi:O-antigen ligase